MEGCTRTSGSPAAKTPDIPTRSGGTQERLTAEQGTDIREFYRELREKSYYCPFYQRERRYNGRFVLNCEAGRIVMPDNEARRRLVYRRCAHPDGWRKCPLAEALFGYYERQ